MRWSSVMGAKWIAVAAAFVLLLTACAADDFSPAPKRRSFSKRLLRTRADNSSNSISDSDSLEDLNEQSSSSEEDEKEIVTSTIEKSFLSRQSFSCPLAKPFLVTGTSTADISPEDIYIIGALGDSLATGKGLWPGTDISFRGAAFPIGGDSNIDGLVTIPNILLEFNSNLVGVSHGMGTREQLPDDQFNCAVEGAKSADMPEQAQELVNRLFKHHTGEELRSHWVMVIITIGTEELCSSCTFPDFQALQRALLILKKNVPRSLVVLLGPAHVSFSHQLTYNLLRENCDCLQSSSSDTVKQLSRGWADAFFRLQSEFNTADHPTFGVLAIPSLTVASRHPNSLFIHGEPLLNRKGHAYAAKWLWNRLMSGPEYNLSGVVLSEDAYFCPSLGCPYFRTLTNRYRCRTVTVEEAAEEAAEEDAERSSTRTGAARRREALREHIVLVVVVIVLSALVSVLFFGTIFYRHGLKATQSRFDAVPGV